MRKAGALTHSGLILNEGERTLDNLIVPVTDWPGDAFLPLHGLDRAFVI